MPRSRPLCNVVVVLAAALALGCRGRTVPPARATPHAEQPRAVGTLQPRDTALADAEPASPSPDTAHETVPLGPMVPAASLRWIAAGGGATPELNQLSLEADLELAVRVFGPRGRVLFADGPASHTVQVLDPAPRGEPLRRRLGDLFDPRPGREAHYRASTLRAHGAATVPAVLALVGAALTGGAREPLMVYLGAHGEQGEQPRDNAVVLWGDEGLSVADLAAVLDHAPAARPVQLVITACYAGGFADLVFADATPEHGPAATARCGLFASTWDAVSSGCDPDPDRRRHEGYGVHFLHALRGEDREGRALPPRDLDFDGDGTISLLEAHSRVRIAGASIDLPTTTSERWLRHAAPTAGPRVAVALPEEDAVIAALARVTGVAPTEAAVLAQLAAHRRAIAAGEDAMGQAESRTDDTRRALVAVLLARWPVLDDPWHPDFEAALRRDSAAIARVLDASPEGTAYTAAQTDAEELQPAVDEASRRAAPVVRLARALETRALAERLRARGGAAWARYQQLLACERGAPPGGPLSATPATNAPARQAQPGR